MDFRLDLITSIFGLDDNTPQKCNSSPPENAWLEDDRCLLGRLGLFSGVFAVKFPGCNILQLYVDFIYSSTK